ncbi:VOC family protein [Deferrisoma palaeochoriense]
MGFVVADLEAAAEAFDRLLGPSEAREIPDVGLRARVYLGGTVEVLSFRGDVPGIDPRVTRPCPGLHHLAVRVPDLDRAAARFAATGLRMLRGFPRPGLHGRIAFLDDPASGRLLELVEAGG